MIMPSETKYNPLALEPLACQPIAGLTSICPQTEVKDHPASLGMPCSQHIESHSRRGFLDRD